ncbi:MAG: universal stress protein [Rhodobacteraceae bacterium]|nr:universal stress protein [Paracoccaceae bacterium]
MHSHILIPVALDHEDIARQKIDIARTMLNDGGKISLLTVLENIPGFVSELVGDFPKDHVTNHVRDSLASVAAGAGDISTDVRSGKAGVVITAYAKEIGADLIIVGSHHPEAEDYFLGSTAARVARRALCSVYILR